jgi:hypothetical protein
MYKTTGYHTGEIGKFVQKLISRCNESGWYGPKYWASILALCIADLKRALRDDAAELQHDSDELKAILADGEITSAERTELADMARRLAAKSSELQSAVEATS